VTSLLERLECRHYDWIPVCLLSVKFSAFCVNLPQPETDYTTIATALNRVLIVGGEGTGCERLEAHIARQIRPSMSFAVVQFPRHSQMTLGCFLFVYARRCVCTRNWLRAVRPPSGHLSPLRTRASPKRPSQTSVSGYSLV